jgi:hypothetical protein
VSQTVLPAASDLRREPNKTDHLILPLAAGVLAHFVGASGSIASSDEDPAGTARLLASLAADGEHLLLQCREPADAWSEDNERYARVSQFALKAWAMMPFWMPAMYAAWKFRDSAIGRDAPIVKWLRASSSLPLVDVVLGGMLGIYAVTDDEEDVMPLLSARARGIRVELADRVRRDGLRSWPQIIHTVSAEWVEGGAARFALDLATATRVIGDPFGEMFDDVKDRWETLERAKAEQSSRKERTSKKAHESVPRKEHESVLHGERARSRELDARLVAMQGERDALALREGKMLSRIEALTARLEAADERIVDLESAPGPTGGEARSQTSLAPPVGVTIPPDALAGRTVVLFTGEDAGDVREAMRSSILAYGASSVTAYWSDRDPGPDLVDPETLVVIDVRHMSHSTYDRLSRLVDRSGCWRCVTQRGASLLGREVARRLRRHVTGA